MNDLPKIMVIGDDSTARQLKSMLVRHNIALLSAGLASGLSVEQASDMCIPIDRPVPRVKELTNADHQRIAAAEAKRTRKAAKRATKEA